MIPLLVLRGAGVGMGMVFLWQLSKVLDQDSLGRLLIALAISAFGGALASGGAAQTLLRDGSRNARDKVAFQHALATASRLACQNAILTGICVLGLSAAGVLPLNLPIALITAMAIVLLAYTAVLAAAERALGGTARVLLATGIFRYALPVLALLQPLIPVQPDPVSLMAIFAFGLLPAMLPLRLRKKQTAFVWRFQKPTIPGQMATAQTGWLLLGQIDLLVAGVVLSVPDAGIYLLARKIAGSVAPVFDLLRLIHMPAVACAADSSRQDATGSQAGREMSRATRVYGGGAALAVAGLSVLILPILGPVFDAATGPALVLLLAQAAPAVFGAAGAIMMMNGMEQERSRLVMISLPMALAAQIPAAYLFGFDGLAVATALLLCGLACASAIVLSRAEAART